MHACDAVDTAVDAAVAALSLSSLCVQTSAWEEGTAVGEAEREGGKHLCEAGSGSPREIGEMAKLIDGWENDALAQWL